MGVTFIGNPFDQEAEYDDSDWEMNAVEEWIMPPQEIAFIDDGGRATGNVFLASEEDSSDSDEDYNPEDDDDNYEFENEAPEFDSYFYDSNEDDDDEDVDYVTFPIPDEACSEPDIPTATDDTNPSESSNTD